MRLVPECVELVSSKGYAVALPLGRGLRRAIGERGMKAMVIAAAATSQSRNPGREDIGGVIAEVRKSRMESKAADVGQSAAAGARSHCPTAADTLPALGCVNFVGGRARTRNSRARSARVARLSGAAGDVGGHGGGNDPPM